MVLIHVIKEPVRCSWCFYHPTSTGFSPSKINHPLSVPIVTIPYHITYKSRFVPHTTHRNLHNPKKHPQFRAAEIQKCILRCENESEMCGDIKRKRVYGFFPHHRRRRSSHDAHQLCDDVSLFPSIPHPARHLNFLRPFTLPPRFSLSISRSLFHLTPMPALWSRRTATLEMLFVYGIIRIIARCT